MNISLSRSRIERRIDSNERYKFELRFRVKIGVKDPLTSCFGFKKAAEKWKLKMEWRAKENGKQTPRRLSSLKSWRSGRKLKVPG